MAPASSSLLLPKHDVFVNFRGEDNVDSLVSHLYCDFQNKKIQYIVGELFSDFEDHLQEIAGSKISIIIFSESYADSKWCLRELVKIIECRKELNQIVIPVFYEIDPTDVRNQTGKFGTAFDRLLGSIAADPSGFHSGTEQIWRNALKEAANLSGFHTSNCGSAAILVDKIVDKVLEVLGIGKYDIFLSFRGGDSDYDFTSLLFKALQTKKIKTFCEDKDNRGDKISIIRAMEGAKIIIIIFSEDYAECNWCLDELVQIRECRHKLNKIVIPVFYSIDPKNIRNQKGGFGTAFDRLLKNYRSKEEGWRSALRDAGKISGFDSSTFRSGAILIDTIVDNVLEKLTYGCSFYSFHSYHDVFLSFRGETRFDFVSHLVKALRYRNIETFFDEELNRGEKISTGLNRANKQSKLSVIIFSENYAGSKWCLDELVKILECMEERNQIVIPVFYKVDPQDVRNQTGKFRSAFDVLVKKHPSKEARWRSALKSAGSIPDAIHSSSCRSAASLVDKIVSTVDDKLKMLKIQSNKEVGSHHPHNISTNPFGRFP